jgi:transcriptional regulator
VLDEERGLGPLSAFREVDGPSELSQIRGLELTIDAEIAKLKFDGGEVDDVRAQVIDGYSQRQGPDDAEARDHLRRRHPPSS